MGLAIAKTKRPITGHPSGSKIKDDDDSDEIDMNTPVKIEHIHIDGVKTTQPDLITKQLEKLLDAKTFEDLIDGTHDAKLHLERLGIFKAIEVFVDVSKEENSTPNGLDVYFIVQESKRLSGNIGTNVGNNEGSMVFGCKLSNLRGSGECLKADISYGTRSSSSYELSFHKPLFKNPDCKFLAKIYKASLEYPQSLFKQVSQGLGGEFALPGLIGLHSIKLDGQWRENCDVPAGAPFIIREQCGHVLKSSIQHALLSDGRDELVLPKKGNLFKHNIELSGIGGNVKFVKSEFEFQVNKEILSDIILSCSFQAGAMKSLGCTDTLINDRFFLGGPTSVRGFAMKGIGPRIREASLGADAFWAAGLHMYTPLPFRPGAGGLGDFFKIHLFANAGNIQNMELTNYNSAELSKIVKEARWSYGIGILMMIGGMARLEVNYCFPRNAKTNDGVNPGLQVGVGMNFL